MNEAVVASEVRDSVAGAEVSRTDREVILSFGGVMLRMGPKGASKLAETLLNFASKVDPGGSGRSISELPLPGAGCGELLRACVCAIPVGTGRIAW